MEIVWPFMGHAPEAAIAAKQGARRCSGKAANVVEELLCLEVKGVSGCCPGVQGFNGAGQRPLGSWRLGVEGVLFLWSSKHNLNTGMTALRLQDNVLFL